MNNFMKLIFIIYLYPYNSYSQEMRICSYRSYMTETELKKACNNFGYSSNTDAEMVVDEILNNIGLYRNFIIKECPNISNAVAATVISSLGNMERYIIYDKEFFKRVKNITKTDWSAVSILAHEIGHHLNGHNLVSGVNNYQSELQADEFSGFVLAKMGATLDESLRAINSFGSEENSKTHPKKSDRIEAISNGWNKSNKNNFKLENSDNIELYNYDEKLSERYYEMALKENKIGNYNLSGDYLLKVFQYSSGKSKVYLYYAASSYINGKDYNKALKYYLLLIKNGIESLDKIIQQEIYKNTALIYTQLGKVNDAINFFQVAIQENPEDTSIRLSLANLYLQNKDFEMYKKLIAEVLEKNPNDLNLIFNLGVISTNEKKAKETIAAVALKDAAKATKEGKIEDSKIFAKTAKVARLEAEQTSIEASKYYKKVMEMDPKYVNAYINLSALMLEDEKVIIDEMISIPPGKNEKRYEELRIKRINLFKSVIPYLQKAVELDPTNIDVAKTLLNVYNALEMNTEYKDLKVRIKAQEEK